MRGAVTAIMVWTSRRYPGPTDRPLSVLPGLALASPGQLSIVIDYWGSSPVACPWPPPLTAAVGVETNGCMTAALATNARCRMLTAALWSAGAANPHCTHRKRLCEGRLALAIWPHN